MQDLANRIKIFLAKKMVALQQLFFLNFFCMKKTKELDFLALHQSADYLFLWYFHTKAVEMDFNQFYDKIVTCILDNREFYPEILLPIAQILGIKKGVPADKLYEKLRAIDVPPPSKLFNI